MPATTLTAADGIVLAIADGDLPDPRARVVIVHGYAEHLGRYDEFVARLEGRNFECHRFDLRGHGHSAGIRGHVARFDEYVADLRLIVERVRNDGPLFVVGHSLGGLISLEYVRRHPGGCHGLAVSNPFLRAGFEVPAVQKMLATIASHLAPTLTLDTPLEPSMVSHDPAVVEAYANDPLVLHTTTPRWFTEVGEAQQQICAQAGEVSTPLLMLLGGADSIADHQLASEVFERVGSVDKTLRTFDGMRHEVFNETQRDVVYAELLAWLERRS